VEEMEARKLVDWDEGAARCRLEEMGFDCDVEEKPIR